MLNLDKKNFYNAGLNKQYTKVYKVVTVIKDVMLSMNAQRENYGTIIPSVMKIKYEYGKVSYPKVGKLFCFPDYQSAKKWCDKMTDGIIIVGKGTNVEECEISYLLGERGFRHVERFWSTKNKSTISEAIWHVPTKTYTCDSFTPLRRVIGC
jgi:hypothetical protein